MREILFRGKRVDNGEWEYGQLKSIHKGGKNYETAYYILNIYGESRLAKDAIDPNTIGQFTGLCDKNGKKIFEGDIVKMDGWWYAAGPAGYSNNLTVVLYDEEYCGFTPMCDYDCDCGVYHPANECEVIGNIYDNPELLEGV